MIASEKESAYESGYVYGKSTNILAVTQALSQLLEGKTSIK